MSQSTTTTTTSSSVSLDASNFCKRIKVLYDSWNSDNSGVWKAANSLVLALGQPNENNPYQKITSFQTWLFGYELRDTIILLLEKNIYILSSNKKIELFQKLSESEQVTSECPNIKFNFLTLNKADNNKSNFEKLISEAKESGDNVGVLLKEQFIGEFGKQWDEAVNKSGLTKVDITPAVSACLLVKDSQEQKNIITSAKITSKVLKSHILPKIETIIDKGERQTHSELAEFAINIFSNPEKISSKLTTDHVDYCYAPIIQSGGNYDLKASAHSDDNPLHFGTIIVSCGARYKNYCSNIARTYIIDPTSEQKKNYNILLNVQNNVIKALKPDVPLSSLYDKAVETINQLKPELLKHFTKNCGYGIGIEFQESLSVISANNSRLAKPGMCLNISCGFNSIENAEAKDDKSKLYAFLIADTVLLNDDGKVEVITEAGKKTSDVVYILGGDDDDDDENDPSVKLELPDDVKGIAGRTRETKEKSKSIEEQRRQHQNMLAQKNKQEAENKLKAMNDQNGKKDSPDLDYTAITKLPNIYSSVGAFPPETVKNKMMIDPKKETVIFPIFGYMVPFHISTIKNISKSEEYIRVNFNTPTAYTQEQIDAGFVPPQLMYIREVTYKVNDPKVLTNNIRLIKELKKKFTTRETEDREKRNLITQEKLILSRGKFPRLPEVHARPTLSGARRTIGILEAHENGLRFNPTSTKDRTPVDVLYKNIKHAIYQQADQESMAVIHFHLHDALMIGKKKTKDVQFYIEISEMSQSLDVSSRFNDEEEEERRERALKEKINNDFKSFIKRVEEIASTQEPPLEFDVPYRELGFYGVPNVSTVFIQPSVHCLLSILEPPFFVLSLDEVEIACFERAIRTLRNFDLTFVFKDYNRPPIRISVIPRNYFETVKEWLDKMNIKFYQSERNYNWKRVMDTIKDDIKKFHDDGGWAFLDPQEEEEEEDDDDEDFDSDYSESESSDYISSMSSGSDDDDEASSEGESWDDLEEKAERDDKKKTFDDANNKRKRDDKSTPSSSSSTSKPSSSKSGSSGGSSNNKSSSSSSKGSSSSNGKSKSSSGSSKSSSSKSSSKSSSSSKKK